MIEECMVVVRGGCNYYAIVEERVQYYASISMFQQCSHFYFGLYYTDVGGNKIFLSLTFFVYEKDFALIYIQ